MTIIILLFGMLIIGAGIWGLVKPSNQMTWLRSVWESSPAALPVVVVIRLFLGSLLILAAPESRYPAGLMVLGAVTLCAAVVAALMGRERIKRYVFWWCRQSGLVIRILALFALALGAFLVHAVL